MEYIVTSVVALFAAFMALFSGFGLGTLLTPAFVFFFPVPVAIAATAIVHLLNNVFRGVLIGRNANWGVVLRFGGPAVLTAIAGAAGLRESELETLLKNLVELLAERAQGVDGLDWRVTGILERIALHARDAI